jgi:hypothetical protein
MNHHILIIGLFLAAGCSMNSDMLKNEHEIGELKWRLSGDGTFTISGNGALPDFYYEDKVYGKEVNLPPWEPYRDNITKLVVGDGVRHIGTFAFYRCTNLTSVTIGKAVTSIGREAFDMCLSLTEIVNYQEIPQEIFEGSYQGEVFGVFGHINKSLCTLLVPAGSIEKYRTDRRWKGFYRMGVIGDPGSIKIEGEWEGITWTLSDEGVLTFGGADCFPGRSSPISAPWYRLPWANYRNSITQIEISKGITEIGNFVFDECDGVRKFINYREIPQTVDDMTFWGVGQYTLLVPDGSVEAYRTADGWKDFRNIEAIKAE